MAHVSIGERSPGYVSDEPFFTDAAPLFSSNRAYQTGDTTSDDDMGADTGPDTRPDTRPDTTDVVENNDAHVQNKSVDGTFTPVVTTIYGDSAPRDMLVVEGVGVDVDVDVDADAEDAQGERVVHDPVPVAKHRPSRVVGDIPADITVGVVGKNTTDAVFRRLGVQTGIDRMSKLAINAGRYQYSQAMYPLVRNAIAIAVGDGRIKITTRDVQQALRVQSKQVYG